MYGFEKGEDVMLYHVMISFAKGREYPYEFSSVELAEHSPEEARRWFDQQFVELKCEIISPTGKVLIIDKILGVAQKAGEHCFINGKAWAAQFSRYALLALARDTVRIDLPGMTISYS
jgi:hypothetical protein